MKYLTVLAVLAGCSQPEWAVDGKHASVPRNMCQMAAYSDAVVFGRIVSIDQRPQTKALSVWQGTRLKMTEFSVAAEKDLKAVVSAGSTVSVLVSAPADATGREIATLSPSRMDEPGWFGLSKLDGYWVMSISGMFRDSSDGGAYDTELGTFQSQAAFEASFTRAISLCPRIDLYGGGAVPDGGYEQWQREEQEARERAYLDAGFSDGGN